MSALWPTIGTRRTGLISQGYSGTYRWGGSHYPHPQGATVRLLDHVPEEFGNPYIPLTREQRERWPLPTGKWPYGWVWCWEHHYLPHEPEPYAGITTASGAPITTHRFFQAIPYFDLPSDSAAFRPDAPGAPVFRPGDTLRCPLGSDLHPVPPTTAVCLTARFDLRESDGFSPQRVAQGKRFRDAMIGFRLDQKLDALGASILYRIALGDSEEEISADLNDMPLSMLRSLLASVSNRTQERVRIWVARARP